MLQIFCAIEFVNPDVLIFFTKTNMNEFYSLSLSGDQSVIGKGLLQSGDQRNPTDMIINALSVIFL